MVDPIDDGGPAFPMPPHMGVLGTWIPGVPGMSLRDWFAGQATANDVENHRGDYDVGLTKYQFTCEQAKYRYADAMLAERNANTGDK